jgi:hypothetical protein
MKTTPPSMQSQSFQAWRETIAEELNATRERIASLELTTAIWRSNNPRRDRCERSWA